MALQPSINLKGFTPMGENRPASDVSNLIPCQLTGKDIYVPTTVYVRPDRLLQTQAKFAAKGEFLAIPGCTSCQPVSVPVVKKRHGKARYIVCLNTGIYFDSIKDVTRKYGLSQQLIGPMLRGVTKSAKGRNLRYATPAEIEQITQNPAWRFDGPLMPRHERKTKTKFSR